MKIPRGISYQPPCSNNSLKTSNGGWAPYYSFCGIWASSIKNIALLPFGKEYKPFLRFSILVSTMERSWPEEVFAVKQHFTQIHGLDWMSYLAIEVLPDPEGPARIIGKPDVANKLVRAESEITSWVGTIVSLYYDTSVMGFGWIAKVELFQTTQSQSRCCARYIEVITVGFSSDYNTFASKMLIQTSWVSLTTSFVYLESSVNGTYLSIRQMNLSFGINLLYISPISLEFSTPYSAIFLATLRLNF